MAFKFPFTNYHELNLTWVLEQLKKLFEESEENVETIETYDDRLSTVESEVSTLETTTSQAINTANAAATNAATALSRANTANENALTAGSQAGAAVTAAQGALQEAQAATQAAQQAQATAMTFDGRITQAQNDASAAVQEAQSFENRVNAAINTANNAANTATIAQGIAVNANQTAAQALDELNAQRAELVAISEEQQEEIEETAERVIASIPSDYTQLSADVKNKAPVIVANASGEIASFKDGADDMEIRHLIATINPIQAGTVEPSPSNVRPISGRTSLYGARTGKNLLRNIASTQTINGVTFTVNADGSVLVNGTATADADLLLNNIDVLHDGNYILSGCPYIADQSICYLRSTRGISGVDYGSGTSSLVYNSGAALYVYIHVFSGKTANNLLFKPMIRLATESDATFEPYNSQTISVNWQTEAGTVYGAMLDLITGALTITDALIDMGDMSWTYDTNNNFFASSSLLQLRKKGIDFTCTCYRNGGAVSDSQMGTAQDKSIYSNSTTGAWINVKDTAYTDAQTFKSAVTGQKIRYALVNTQTYQLDPVTVKTLLGYNNIFTDCGPVSVDYPADTKLYIDGKFAELQALVLEH